MLLIGEDFSIASGIAANAVIVIPQQLEGQTPQRFFNVQVKHTGPGGSGQVMILHAQESINGTSGWVTCIDRAGAAAGLQLVAGAADNFHFIVRPANWWIRFVTSNTGGQCVGILQLTAVARPPLQVA